MEQSFYKGSRNKLAGGKIEFKMKILIGMVLKFPTSLILMKLKFIVIHVKVEGRKKLEWEQLLPIYKERELKVIIRSQFVIPALEVTPPPLSYKQMSIRKCFIRLNS